MESSKQPARSYSRPSESHTFPNPYLRKPLRRIASFYLVNQLPKKIFEVLNSEKDFLDLISYRRSFSPSSTFFAYPIQLSYLPDALLAPFSVPVPPSGPFSGLILAQCWVVRCGELGWWQWRCPSQCTRARSARLSSPSTTFACLCLQPEVKILALLVL